ncbi:MAG: xanthine dehydrogenase family protein [Candidatus Riflebacteria bacterium]|nr:xanthine dehydrogenase family protein [Candidatus Riflebacteria bacterium]
MPAVGSSVPRKDAWDKVTGKARFVDDYSFPGIVHVATVRSPVAFGRIDEIDFCESRMLPGVLDCFTWRDIPGKNINPLVYPDQPFLAEQYARFYGEAIALIAAETREIAEEAVRRVKLKITKMTPVLSIRESLKPDSIKIYGNDNIFTRYTIKKGNAEEAIKSAKYFFEQEYETPYQEHAYLETQGMIAIPGIEDTITVNGSMQCPFYVHDAVSQILGLSKNKVRIVQSTTGGGFGGKEDFPSLVAGHAALVAKKLGRPTKLIYRREEDIISSSKRHPSLVKFKAGVNENGKLVAAIVDYFVDAGAFATLSPIVLWRGTVHAVGPYVCDNVLIRTAAVATNKVPCGAYRGFGSPQVIFAGESMIDEIAYELNLDPIEIRRRNILRIGDSTVTNQKIDKSCGLEETLDKAYEKSNWKEKWKPYSSNSGIDKIKKGIGVSTIYYGVGLGAGGKHLDRAGASMTLLHDGSVHCAVGNTEMGQGARTVLAQIAADALGVPYPIVHVIETDTSFVPDSGPTVASRTTFMSGNALISAAKDLRTRLLPLISELLKCPIEDADLVDGLGFSRKALPENGGKSIQIQELTKEFYSRRLMPSSFGWYVAPNTDFDKESGQGNAYFTYSYCTNIAEVEVDSETGVVKVTKITSAHDMGKAINPQQVEGQIQGGALQGVGYATTEEIRHDKNGRMLNDAFATYILPTFEDGPEIVPIIVEHAYDQGPFGAKGFGEVPLMGIAPAIANAVFNATGKRVRIIPIKPEILLEN